MQELILNCEYSYSRNRQCQVSAHLGKMNIAPCRGCNDIFVSCEYKIVELESELIACTVMNMSN